VALGEYGLDLRLCFPEQVQGTVQFVLVDIPEAKHGTERMGLARLVASRRSVLMRSPGFRGINDGATTTHSWPLSVNCQWMP